MERKSGILLPIFSLYGNYSYGSFGKSAYEFADFLSDCKFKCWQILPLAICDEFGSPYKSSSSYAINPYFADLEMLYDDGLLDLKDLSNAKQSQPYLCETERLAKERIQLLKTAYKNFKNSNELENFAQSNPKVSEYCKFKASSEFNKNKPWREWTADYYRDEDYFFSLFVQYVLINQWNRLKKYANSENIEIIGDLPFYSDENGADVYYGKKYFELDSSYKPEYVAAVPPDIFSKDGQLWGNPVYKWNSLKNDGYSYWTERIRYSLELYDRVRLDHFRAFSEFYKVRYGEKSAVNGIWAEGPGKDIIDVFGKEFENGKLIAEDLGEYSENLEELLSYCGYPRMNVMQFAFGDIRQSRHSPHNYLRRSIAYTGTHDNETLLGKIYSLSERERKNLFSYLGADSTEQAIDFAIRMLLFSASDTVIIPIQDILHYGNDTRINTPGTVTSNWKFRITEKQLTEIDRGKFSEFNEMYGR